MLGHVALKVDELAQNVLVVGFHGSEAGGHLIVTSGEMIDLALEGFERPDILDGRVDDSRGSGGVNVSC